ncbi:MAG TPA: helix-turn-helix domain-containing protein [Vicinamibacterales bacterium]|jgi:excisionase family DNA binding protein
MPIRDLAEHPAHFVTVAELAEYWAVSRQQIYKRIESGALEAICLGSRLYRVRTAVALEYERRASVNGAAREGQAPASTPNPTPPPDKFPKKIGLQRVR